MPIAGAELEELEVLEWSFLFFVLALLLVDLHHSRFLREVLELHVSV